MTDDTFIKGHPTNDTILRTPSYRASASGSLPVVQLESEPAPPIRPFGSRILVRRDPPKETTDGGLVKVNVAAPTRGEIIAVGAEVRQLRVGMRIMFTHFSGTAGRPGREAFGEDMPDDLVMMREDEVLGILP